MKKSKQIPVLLSSKKLPLKDGILNEGGLLKKEPARFARMYSGPIFRYHERTKLPALLKPKIHVYDISQGRSFEELERVITAQIVDKARVVDQMRFNLKANVVFAGTTGDAFPNDSGQRRFFVVEGEKGT